MKCIHEIKDFKIAEVNANIFFVKKNPSRCNATPHFFVVSLRSKMSRQKKENCKISSQMDMPDVVPIRGAT